MIVIHYLFHASRFTGVFIQYTYRLDNGIAFTAMSIQYAYRLGNGIAFTAISTQYVFRLDNGKLLSKTDQYVGLIYAVDILRFFVLDVINLISNTPVVSDVACSTVGLTCNLSARWLHRSSLSLAPKYELNPHK